MTRPARARLCRVGSRGLALAIALASTKCAFAGEPSRKAPDDASKAQAARIESTAAAPLPSRDIRWSATLGGAVDAGSLPHVAPGLSLGFDVHRGGLAARVVGSAFLPQVDRASGTSVALFDAMAMLCALAPLGRFDLGACGGAGVGWLRAEAAANTPPASASRVRPQGLGTLRFDVQLLPALLLSLEAGTLIDPLRSPLPLTGREDAGKASRSSVFAFRAALALGLRFW
ncbi:MAG TPA: hypothetical protein VM580_06190 [Labilithrix sp.]|nr:hypothetical protein [Labilithrix sp.]